jgi:nucleoid DNA-binding protein
MKKQDIAKRIARKSRVSPAAAADRLDRLIHDILTELKRGNPVSLPGLGTLTPGAKLDMRFDKTKSTPGGRRDEKR